MLVEGVRVPGVPVVKTDTSGGGVGGGGSSTYCTRQYYYRSLSDAIAFALPVRRRAPRACRMSLASPVLLAQGLALSTHHTTRPLPALAHGRIHTRPRRSNIRESGRQHARRRRLLSGWP